MKLGFIGTGNMGGALAKAASKTDKGITILLANRTAKKAERLAAEISGERNNSILVCDAGKAAAEADFLFLGVKPQMMEEMLASIKDILAGRTDIVLVTMAAGLSISGICEMLGAEFPVIRIMPNTPAAVGEGMILYDYNEKVSSDKAGEFLEIMKNAGLFSRLNEKLIDAGSAVSGCGPAFAYIFAEALADGGVACGLPRNEATVYAAQMMLGSAKMILETKENPGKLKCDVCSPGGTTIQGVRALEAGGFRSAVFEAVTAAYEKTLALKK